MGKSKVKCSKCGDRHYPPTGKKCRFVQELQQPDAVQGVSNEHSIDTQSSNVNGSAASLRSPPKVNGNSTKRDSVVNSTKEQQSPLGEPSTSETSIQEAILFQLQKVNQRLDRVESQVNSATGPRRTQEQSRTKLSSTSNPFQVLSRDKTVESDSEFSDDFSDVPPIREIRSSKAIQRSVDKTLSNLDRATDSGNAKEKFKSKRGGVEVVVSRKVAWPHEHILGGANRQRLTYDQLNIMQFVQGFIKNVIDEPDSELREHMLLYLSELMEDANDFSWQNAKAAHAVLCCEMERGSLGWQDTHRIDRIRRAHAQRHSVGRQTLGKPQEFVRKPWFCKNYQMGTCQSPKDHEVNGRLHRHICAHCLNLGKYLNHPEKDCFALKRQKQAKNE